MLQRMPASYRAIWLDSVFWAIIWQFALGIAHYLSLPVNLSSDSEFYSPAGIVDFVFIRKSPEILRNINIGWQQSEWDTFKHLARGNWGFLFQERKRKYIYSRQNSFFSKVEISKLRNRQASKKSLKSTNSRQFLPQNFMPLTGNCINNVTAI